jgi:phosphocarrier protein HPr
MFQKEIVINNRTGLHARPASELVELCSKFESAVTLVSEDEEINAKSIVSILSGGIYQGTKITLQIDGADENKAGPQIVNFMENLPD